ncbi:MAG: hypothetical protein OXB96_00890 [Candidatus Kaiserbacteria bacterium]|nr:hypothetical protein [Candidatus Kaiserbacteria bacterium]
MQEVTCESLEQQYQALQDTADEYRAILMSEGSDSEKAKELRTSFATETERLRENIVFYKEKREGIFYLSAEYRSGAAYIEALEERGFQVLLNTKHLLNRLHTIPEGRVRLKKVTMRDLGLPGGSTTREVLKAAKAQGFKPCPAWVGPQHCLTDDTKEDVAIGMKPLDNFGGDAYVFRTVNTSYFHRSSQLITLNVGSGWPSDKEFLFVSDK